MKVLLVLLLCSLLHAHHPIYILFTHPGAMSASLEHVMGTKEEILILDSPFFHPYAIEKYDLNSLMVDSSANPSVTFEEIEEMLFSLAEKKSVFFKESAESMEAYLERTPAFYQNSQVHIAFLVRDPAKSILSFYKKAPFLDASFIGHERLWKLFTLLKENGKTPLVIDTDLFLKNPLPILHQLGKKWNLEFAEDNLTWEMTSGKDLHPINWLTEMEPCTTLPHSDLEPEKDKHGLPLFPEAKNEITRVILQHFYQEQYPYYQKFLRFALKP